MVDALRTHCRLLFASDGLLRVKRSVNGKEVIIYLRPGTSDLDVFDEVFVQGEYAIDLGNPRGIVDAGAHIGLATVYLAARFPDAKIVAIEPEATNFMLLKRNIAALSNVTTVQAGLWSHRAFVKVVDLGYSTWGFRVVETTADDPAGIPAIGITDALQHLQGLQPLALKIDIEGAEVEALANSEEWINKVDYLMIELHDRFRPGCTEALNKAVAGRQFKRTISGESIILSGVGSSNRILSR